MASSPDLRPAPARERLMRAAADLFYAEGYGVSIESIAEPSRGREADGVRALRVEGGAHRRGARRRDESVVRRARCRGRAPRRQSGLADHGAVRPAGRGSSGPGLPWLRVRQQRRGVPRSGASGAPGAGRAPRPHAGAVRGSGSGGRGVASRGRRRGHCCCCTTASRSAGSSTSPVRSPTTHEKPRGRS